MMHIVPAGKKAFPRHAHHANEEMFFILSGAGIYRVGAESFPIRANDVIAAPAGDGETAHQIVNTGTTSYATWPFRHAMIQMSSNIPILEVRVASMIPKIRAAWRTCSSSADGRASLGYFDGEE